MYIETFFTEISDGELDRVLLQIKANHPTDGEVMMLGHLTHRGVFVPRARLRASIHRVDHENTMATRSVTMRRRVLTAQTPYGISMATISL